MAHIDWLIVGKSFGHCNCDYGCPCQVECLPTHGAFSGSATTSAPTLKDSYGQFNDIRHQGGGVH